MDLHLHAVLVRSAGATSKGISMITCRRRFEKCLFMAFFATSFFSVGHAHASMTEANACGSFGFGNCNSDSGTTYAKATNVGNGIADRTYDVSAEAAPGALRAYAFATAADLGGQAAVATASFSDAVHFSLPPGTTQFGVTVSIFLDGSCMGTPGGSTYPNSTCYALLDLSAGRGLNNIDLHLDAPGMTSGTLLLNPGDDLPFQERLQIGGLARFGFFKADFAHTGRLGLSSSTPGVSFSSDSGHDYSLASIPEPSTWMLMALGVGVFGLRRYLNREEVKSAV